MELANVFALIGIILGVAGSLFIIYMNLSSKIDRIYVRIDENKEQYYREFVRKESHVIAIENLKELYEQKHDGLENLVKEKLDNLANEIKQLKDLIKATHD